METCYRHPSRETGVSCSNCGRPICPDCMTPTSVGMRCPECAAQKTKVKTIRSVESSALQVTTALIAVNVVAFFLSGQFSAGGTSTTKVFTNGALFGPSIDQDHEYWRLITGGFLHAGFIHIFFNMYLLYILGQMMESTVGSVRFATIYFVALLGGSFGALVITPDAVTVGASGAVFGLMGAAFVELRSRGIDPFQTQIGPLILLNLGISFVLSGISIGGHIGGLIGGGLAMLVFHQADRRGASQLGLVINGGLAVLFAVGGVLAAGQA